jgi:hypothetical protein
MFRSSKSGPASDGQTYIPPHIESAMAEHVQQSMPAHLEKYQGGNTYIPQHAQEEMTQHLENTLPPHMKQYAGAYMQQRVVEPSLARRGMVTPATPPETQATPVAPTGPQPTFTGIPQPGSPISGAAAPGQSVAPQQPGNAQAAPASPDQAYSFIMEPEKQPKQFFLGGLFSGKSMAVRAVIIVGGLIVLLIVFSLLRGLLSNKPDLTTYLGVVQQQQELLHLTSNTSAQAGMSTGNLNSAATIQAAVATSQSDTIKYMAENGKKIKDKELNVKVSLDTDNKLKDAQSAGNFNQVYRDALETELNNYNVALNAAYSHAPGPKGKALIKDSYNQLLLLQLQLKESTNQ